MGLMDLTLGALAAGILSMLVVIYLAWRIHREEAGTPRMAEIAHHIQEGANTFLRTQYKTILFLIVVLSVPMGIFFELETAFAFVFGALLSLTAAYIGMQVAVRANVRTVNAARTSSTKALTLAFRGGTVMGLSVVGLSLIGISLLYYLFRDPDLIVGFGFGASLAALVAQLGGGIFTKAADIGADLVGKIEASIPEDDPRNPAVIADLVGDNVGDCAGRGSDIFESISADYVTAMILGSLIFSMQKRISAAVFPLMIGMVGILATLGGVSVVRGWKKVSPLTSFNLGLLVTTLISVAGAFVFSVWLLNDITIFLAVLSGLVATLIIGVIAEYYVGIHGKPVRKIAEASERGAAINLLTGLSYALQSPFFPLITVAAVLLFAYTITGGFISPLNGIYGIVAANLGTDLIAGILMSSDTFGPISDNAQGIAEMSGMSKEISETLGELDAMGNTTKAYTKAYVITSAAVSTIVMFATYYSMVNIGEVTFLDPFIISGLLIGAALPFLFSSLTIGATAKAALEMVDEVRRQFNDIPGILEGKAEPNYAQCIDISTKNALKKMVLPSILAVASPIILGLILGKYALAGMLIGQLLSAALLAPLFAYGGGAWDNAKKYIEAGRFGKKQTAMHAAAVVGDTFGDPLKDVAGPTLDTFIKLSSMTAILIAPILLLL